ncbi:MAG: hypothetical protein KGS61_11685, partial [Verrucomicrobia bacterium]|nr:hypothetical protein [Verrucomicrobiota bacterium]
MRSAYLRGLGLCLALLWPRAVPAQLLSTEVRLALSADLARPGDTVWAGVVMRLAPGWHNYWRNPGDSGAPTQVQWTLPRGVSAGAIQWPVPEKLTEEGLVTYVYNNEVCLLVPLTLATNLAPGPLQLGAHVTWLECQKQCVMHNTDLNATLRVGAEPKPSADAGLLRTWRQKVPRLDPTFPAHATWDSPINGDARPVILAWDAPGNPAVADFFPFPSDAYQVTNATERLPAGPGKVRLRKVVYKGDGGWPTALQGLIIDRASADAPVAAREVRLTLADAASTVATVSAGSARQSMSVMLAFGFLGGLILNIMPCVLPVIALKILGFVSQSREAPRRVRALGLVYALGVLVSFLGLAAMVIGVQHAGHAANWGMQFQNPKFLVLMTTLVMLVALNLFGVFEVNLGGRALGVAGQLTSKEGAAGAFFNGVLATALATPCTAPFLAPALGFAFAQSAGVIVVIFVAIGLGLASPYVLLSWHPAWLRFLPKPGAWMEKFKQAMGFPMLATAVWLLTVASAFYGEDSYLWLGLFLVMVALAAWVWGEFVQRGRNRKALAMAITAILVLLGYFYVLENQIHWRAPFQSAQAPDAIRNDPDGIQWQPWSPAAVAAARAQ